MITVQEVKTKKEMKKFIMFPFELYKNDKNWVPPLIFDEWNTFSRTKNPAFEFCDAAFFLAYKDGKVAGRIVAIINNKSNETWNEKRTRFGWISFIDDKEVSKALLDTAEEWGKLKGMEGIHGPLGFCDMDPEGMLVEGFENLPAITSAYNYPYIPEHMVYHGYRKSVDWVQYKFPASQDIPEKLERVNKMIAEKYNIEVYFAKNKAGIRKYVHKFFNTLNAAFKNLYGYTELNAKQIDYYADAYFGFVRTELVCFLLDENDEVVGFGVTMPSLSKAFQKAKGRLFPFGFIYILRALKKFDTVDLYFNGVHPDWQQKGIHSLYYVALNNVYKDFGVKYAISTGQLENNINAVGIWNNYEKTPYYRTRCFIKE